MKIVKYNPLFLGFVSNGEKTFLKTLSQDYIIPASYFKKYYNHEGFKVFILLNGNSPIGYICFSYIGIKDSMETWELNTIYINNGFRKKGLSKKLFKESVKKISNIAIIESILAENIISNNGSDKLLSSLNFIIEDEIDDTRYYKLENNNER